MREQHVAAGKMNWRESTNWQENMWHRVTGERTVARVSRGENTRRETLAGGNNRKSMVEEQLAKEHVAISKDAVRKRDRRRRGAGKNRCLEKSRWSKKDARQDSGKN